MKTINYTMPSDVSIGTIDDDLHKMLIDKYGKVKMCTSMNERCYSSYDVLGCDHVLYEVRFDGRIHVTTNISIDERESAILIMSLIRKERDRVLEYNRRRRIINSFINKGMIAFGIASVFSLLFAGKYAFASFVVLFSFFLVIKIFYNAGRLQ